MAAALTTIDLPGLLQSSNGYMTEVFFLVKRGIDFLLLYKETQGFSKVYNALPSGSTSKEVDGREYRVDKTDAHCEVGVVELNRMTNDG